MPNRDHITKVKSVLPNKHRSTHASSCAMQGVASQGRGKLYNAVSGKTINTSWLCHHQFLSCYNPKNGVGCLNRGLV
ncbi:hypothetical protein ALT785_60102 [Alteromonas infernus]